MRGGKPFVPHSWRVRAESILSAARFVPDLLAATAEQPVVILRRHSGRDAMRGLMMDYQLTVPAILRRAETFSGHVEIVSREADGTLYRYRYHEMIARAKRLARLLSDLGIREGHRVATLAWNHRRHLEAYFGVPSLGAVLHTLNLRLHPDELAYIVEHAGDRVLLVDRSLLSLFEQFRARVNLEHVIVFEGGTDIPAGASDYDASLAGIAEEDFTYPDLNEQSAASMCYSCGHDRPAEGRCLLPPRPGSSGNVLDRSRYGRRPSA